VAETPAPTVEARGVCETVFVIGAVAPPRVDALVAGACEAVLVTGAVT
jgi:hypothetical protein